MRLYLKFLVYSVVFPVLILLCCSSISFNQSDKNYKIAKATMMEILNITKLANVELKELDHKDIKGHSLFLEVKNITERQLKKIAPLQEKFNELPSSSRLSYLNSEEGTICLKQLNEEMTNLKAKATYLLKDIEILPFELGCTVDLSKTLMEPITLPTESKKNIEAKCEFLNFLIQDVTNISAVQKGEWLNNLKNLRLSAINGDGIATAEINALLNKMIEIFPKDNPKMQNNLGLFYLNIDETKEAKKWFMKASKQGNSDATKELEKLKNK